MVTAKTNRLKALNIRRRECSRQYRRVHKGVQVSTEYSLQKKLGKVAIAGLDIS